MIKKNQFSEASYKNKKSTLNDMLQSLNWDDLHKWFNQQSEATVDVESLSKLQTLVRTYNGFTSQSLIVLQDTFNLLAAHSKLLTNRPQLLLKSVELILQLNQQLVTLSTNSIKPYKTLIALFKFNATILNDTKDAEILLSENKLQLPEQYFKIVFRYLFIGLTKYQNQLFNQQLEYGNSSSSGISSSSDADSSNGTEASSTQRVLQKLRSQAMVLLQYIIRQLPKTVQANWQMMLKSTGFSQNFYNRAVQGVISVDDEELLRKEFNEPSLLATLLLEPQKKVRLNAISALVILFDMLSVSKWIAGHEFEKYEKQIKSTTAKQSFQPKAYQLYQAAKNTHLTLMYQLSTVLSKSLLPDFQMMSMIFKLYQVVLNTTSILEKIPDELGIQPLCQLYLIPIFQEKLFDGSKYTVEQANNLLNVKICNLQVLGIVAQVGSKQYAIYLGDSYAIHLQTLMYLEQIILTKSIQNENLVYLLIQELFVLLGKLQQHYQHILFENMVFWQKFEQIKSLIAQHKYLVLWYRVVEEIVKYLPATTSQDDKDQVQDLDKLPELKNSTSQNTQELLQFQDMFLQQIIPDILKDILESINPEIAASGLNILTELPQTFWEHNIDLIPWIIDKLNDFYNLIFEEGPLSTSQMRIQFYRCIGILTHYQMVEKHTLLGFFSKVQDKILTKVQFNVHVLEKISWALANICSHLLSLDLFDSMVIDKVFQLLMHLSTSNKEKLATNGLRGLGHFMHQVTSEISLKCPQLTTSITTIIQCYEKSLVNKNPKISWNASYSLNNFIKGSNHQLSRQLISSPAIQGALSHVMQNRGNLKILIHCYELLISAQIFITNIEWQTELLRETLKILYELQDIQTFLEQRYQARLRWQSFLLCAALLQKLPKISNQSMLYKQLHDNGTLQRLIEESYELLLQFGKTCEQNQVLFQRGDLSREQLMQNKVINEHDPIYTIQKIEEESETASNVKYLKVVSPNPQFVQALEVVQIVCFSVMNLVNHSDEPVSFNLVQALEELANQTLAETIVIKLQI